MINKLLKYVGVAVACLVVVVLSSALLFRKYLQHKVAEERAITSPNGINSLEAVRIGGIDQWIELRGQDVSNPILLFIHGVEHTRSTSGIKAATSESAVGSPASC